MTNMNTSEFLRGVDHAAAKDDRWLFIASLVLLGLFGVWVVRYFVKQHERLLDDPAPIQTQGLLERRDARGGQVISGGGR